MFGQDINQVDKEGRKHGLWIEKYENGQKMYEGTFKAGKPIGVFHNYDEEGNKRSSIKYTEKDTVGVTFFHMNGKKQGTGNYLNKKKEGKWVFFDQQGKMISKEYYIKGVKEGVSYLFYDKGNIAQVDTFVTGKKDGLQTRYFTDGKKKSEILFDHDQYHGKYIEYFPNGGFKVIGKYFEGKADGSWVYYHEDGEVHFKEEYSLGKRISMQKMNGEFKEYYEDNNDILKEVVVYKNGMKNGPFIEYYKTGEWKYKTVSYDPITEPGRPDEEVRYFDGEKIKRKGVYQNDKLHGDVRYYKESGEIEKIEKYENGVLKETE